MPRTTRADEAAAELRADILAGRLRPGEQLKFQAFAARVGASIGVIREAFSKLVELGLAEVEAHQGYRVKRLSYRELRDLTTARLHIEVLAFEDAIRHGTLRWEADLIAAHHVLDQTPLHDPGEPTRMSDEWSAANEHFHAALLATCSNQRLLGFALRLREEAELYRRWSVSLPNSGARDLPGEHRRLMELATKRSVEEAGNALREHITMTADLVLEVADDEPVRPATNGTDPG